ncbi:MAG: TetR/AcrR family transcriptional regulator [Betaproteobacteria bacterium]|nr:TetR/AcrR family transcriptional regulator [Betaproteobacteria bacterium]
MNRTRTRRSSESRQSEIVDSVLKLAAEHSPGSLTTQAIADAVGVTQAAIFRHFPNKQAILLATIGWVEEHLLSALEAAAKEAGTPLDALRRVFFAHVGFVLAMPGVPRLIFNELQQAPDSPVKNGVRRLLERYRRLVSGLLVAAAASGEVDATLDTGAAATLFIGTVQGLVMQSMLADNIAAMRTAAEQVFPIFLRGIRGQA